MADAKQILVEVVAVERAFIDGRLVHPGTKRTLDLTPREGDKPARLTPDGKQRKLPKWAALADAPVKVKAPVDGDTRPADAKRAAKAKADGLGEQALV